MMQLGMRQARYRGRMKTRFQLLMAATVANLTLVAATMSRLRAHGAIGDALSVPVLAALGAVVAVCSAFGAFILDHDASPTVARYRAPLSLCA